MKNFTDFYALHNFLEKISESVEGEPVRNLFSQILQEQLEFTPEQARIYSSVVLTQDSNGSGDWVSMNAAKLSDTWVHMDQFSSGGFISNKTTTWEFNDNLTYLHKIEKYDSTLNLGTLSNFSAVVNPKPVIEYGIWAPTDSLDLNSRIVIISSSGHTSFLKIVWPEEGHSPKSCKIDDVSYARQW